MEDIPLIQDGIERPDYEKDRAEILALFSEIKNTQKGEGNPESNAIFVDNFDKVRSFLSQYFEEDHNEQQELTDFFTSDSHLVTDHDSISYHKLKNLVDGSKLEIGYTCSDKPGYRGHPIIEQVRFRMSENLDVTVRNHPEATNTKLETLFQLLESDLK